MERMSSLSEKVVTKKSPKRGVSQIYDRHQEETKRMNGGPGKEHGNRM